MKKRSKVTYNILEVLYVRTLEEVKDYCQRTKNWIDIKKVGRDGFGGTVLDRSTQTKLNFIASHGAGFEHVSVSLPTRCPSWEQMCLIKDVFWREDECCMQLHPKKEDYVNNHPYCLHIWRPIDKDIPTPPSIMVGLKNSYTDEEFNDIIKLIDNNELPNW